MNYTRIKVCGITRVQDALHCEEIGVDAIGFVFVEKSKRCISISAAQAIASLLGPFVTRVGLFLDPAHGLVEDALSAMPDLLPQFHGRESEEFCDSFKRPYVKAIGVGSGMPQAEELNRFQHAAAFLFDSNAAGELGGTGHTFDWTLLRNDSTKPLILAGGLDAENVESAIHSVRPYAVDVSSGVEQMPGIKDVVLLNQFVNRVRGMTE